MAVIAPPRRPDSRNVESTVEPDRGGEALIEEAKQHARRRRRRVAVAATVASVVVAGAVTAALVTGGAGSSSSESSSSPAGAEAPAVGSAEAEYVDLVASWASRAGWVMIFSDAGVLRPGPRDVIEERRLSPAGLDLVRTGRVTAHDVYFDSSFEVQPDASAFPDDSAFDRRVVWADRNAREYVPTEFAVCADAGWIPATSVVHRLPDAVRDAVIGTHRNIPIAVFGQLEYPADWGTEKECFVLNSEEVSAIAQFADSVEGSSEDEYTFTKGHHAFTFTKGYRQEILVITVEPVLPDGSVVHWGG